MRIVMMGTGPFAVPTLQALAESRHEVTLVVTRPATGRKAEASPIQRTAEALGLEVWSPPTVNSAEAQQRLASVGADLLVVCDYGEILRPDTLATTRLGGINLHGSLLPKHRGAAPVQWAILRGETETGNSVIHMTPGLDAGPILGQQRTPIDPDEDAAELEHRLADLGANLVSQVIGELEHGTAAPLSQDASQASKAPRLRKEQGIVDWWRSAQDVKNQVRGLRPWPRAFTFWQRVGGEQLRINIDRVAVVPADEGSVFAASKSGTIVEAGTRLVVSTGDGLLEVLELQPAGKRSMSAADFVRGYRIAVGEQFGP